MRRALDGTRGASSLTHGDSYHDVCVCVCCVVPGMYFSESRRASPLNALDSVAAVSWPFDACAHIYVEVLVTSPRSAP